MLNFDQRQDYARHLHLLDRLTGMDEKLAQVPKHSYGN